jgi:NAD(P)-dependent dehydrogenase (short-subunit alcohol dehydrogenase family)
MTRKVALVTGGAKRIGAEICRALAGRGYAVIIHFNRSQAEAEALADSLRQRGARTATVQGDLADLAGIGALYDRACRDFGAPDLLVNNASVLIDDTATTLTPETLNTCLATNLQAPVLLTNAFARTLPGDEYGAIINLIDQRVLRPNPQFFSYTLAKAALYTATRTLAQSFAPRIRVNGVGPGPTFANPRDGADGLTREASGIPLGRVIDAQEIADAVIFLAEASSITGQMIAVDGGQHFGWKTPDFLA